ncbi:MAG TPA: fumarylacetoacetate hydrolase family protein [Candidatus Acidoferrum sp.]|jgi:2-keto-4-pentenoate hydratase/2-oxohepta-3-ene-1,7-dioic acid hydratase in catechol pathway
MKLVSFHGQERKNRVGAIAPGDRMVDLNAAYALYLRDVETEGAFYALADARVPSDMRGLFENGDRGLNAARTAFDYVLRQGPRVAGPSGEPIIFRRDSVTIKAPIAPKKFFHTAGNFREHHVEAEKSGFSHPVLPWIVFFQNVDAIIGPDEAIVYPEHLTQELDYELELAVVMKKSGKHFTAEQAGEYIGGYVIFNDVTARDIQRQEMKSGVFSFCKAIDTFCPLGPHIVTADEVPNPNDLSMELRVNGKVRQQSHSSKMSVTIPEIIAHYSSMGYSAGDVLSTGTVSGVAAFSDDPKSLYLKVGDVVECEIEKIGVLRNPVVSYKALHGQKSTTVAASDHKR